MSAVTPAAAGATGTVRDDQAALRAVVDAYADRLRTADVEAIVDLYTPDACVMGPELPTIVGRDQLATVYRGALEAVAMDFRFEVDAVRLRGDTATVRTHSSGTTTVRATGAAQPSQHRELFVLVRSGEGWRICDYMFDRPPA